MDDCLAGSDSARGAVELQHELQALFDKGGFLLRKWNASDPSVLQHIAPYLQDTQRTLSISDSENYTKTLGIEWSSNSDHFRLTVADLPQVSGLTKRALVSDISKTFDVLGWYSPTIVKAKILLQALWSEGAMGVCSQEPQNASLSIVENSRLKFEELITVLSQIEVCLNSRHLGVIPHYNDEGIEVLTPGHFVIGCLIEAIPDHVSSYQSISILRRWHLCETVVRHFWRRWQEDYLTSL